MHLNLRGQVSDDLGRKIISGEIQPGQGIPHEESLRETYGVSRTVTREAIRSLAAKGLVISKPKLGTIVCPKDEWNYLDKDVLNWAIDADSTGSFFLHLTDLRKSIEPTAAKMVAMHGSDETIASIEDCLHEMEASTADVEAYVEADFKFHITILNGAQNPLFSPIANVIRQALKHSLQITNRSEESNLKSIPIHKSITQAIKSRQPELAHVSMLSHFQDLENRLKK